MSSKNAVAAQASAFKFDDYSFWMMMVPGVCIFMLMLIMDYMPGTLGLSAAAGYWVGCGMAMSRRRDCPTTGDAAFVRAGYMLLLMASPLIMAGVFVVKISLGMGYWGLLR